MHLVQALTYIRSVSGWFQESFLLEFDPSAIKLSLKRPFIIIIIIDVMKNISVKKNIA